QAIRRRLRPGAVVVVRDGERGCHVFHHGRGTEIPAFPQTPVDTNGAGDTHTGVLLAERALGADWESAATRANAAAAIAVTRRGRRWTSSSPDLRWRKDGLGKEIMDDRTFHDFSATSIDGEHVDLSEFRGGPVLVVNTATQCAFTPQLRGLQELHERFSPHG